MVTIEETKHKIKVGSKSWDDRLPLPSPRKRYPKRGGL